MLCNAAIKEEKQFDSLIYLNGVVLSRIITYNLSWKPQQQSAKKLGGLLAWFIGSFHSNPVTLLKLCLTVIRPNLEYASSVWDPSQKQWIAIDTLKSVQTFGLRMCLKSWNESYDDLLIRINPFIKDKTNADETLSLVQNQKDDGVSRCSNRCKEDSIPKKSINNSLIVPWAYQYIILFLF